MIRQVKSRMAGKSSVRLRAGLRVSAVIAVAALGLTGCQAVPGSGPVQQGLSELSSNEPQLLFNPGVPEAGATQEEIVLGFVRAASNPNDDYAVARQFLSPQYSGEWDPSHAVFVFEGGQTFSIGTGEVEGAEAVGTLRLGGIAIIDKSGLMEPTKPGAPTEARFELEKSNGEWRIASAPAGVILDRQTFLELWASRPVYYLTPDDRLIAQSRWFLNRATQTTQIVRELLAGPSAQMAASLRSAFPAGTSLTSNSVPVSNGIAHIDLSVELLQADAPAMKLIKRQLAASLQAVPGVSSFEISVDGVTVDSGSIATDDSVILDRPNAVIVSGGHLGALTTSGMEVLEHLSSRIMQLGPTAISMALDQKSAAVRNAEGIHWVSEADVVQLDVRADLLEPSLDLFGYVWSFASSAPGVVLVTKPGESQELLPIQWINGRSPVALRISKSGTRIAALFADGDWSTVVIGSIVRDASGRPLAVSELSSTQMWVSGTPLDLDWIDDQGFAVLSRNGTAGRVSYGSPGDFSTSSGAVTDAIKLGGGGGRSGLRVLSSDGRVYGSQGLAGWQLQAETVQLLAKYG